VFLHKSVTNDRLHIDDKPTIEIMVIMTTMIY
jgi:hypothetical protein